MWQVTTNTRSTLWFTTMVKMTICW